MPIRNVHFQFWRGSAPASNQQIRLKPRGRVTDGAIVAVEAVAEPVQLDENGEATVPLLTTVEGTAAGWEVFEAPGALPGPKVFQVPEGDGTLEYAESLPPQAGGYIYDLTGDIEFPDDAPLGSWGVDADTGIFFKKGI